MSAYLATAALTPCKQVRLAGALVTDYETEHGPLPAASRQRARQFLIEAGLIDDEPQRAAG